MKELGGRKFQQSRERRMQKGPPPTVSVEVSASTLLNCVGLANCGDKHRRLEYALDRLLKQIAEQPPVLASWEPLADNRVRLEVAGEWIYARDEAFKYLPLPLPLRSASTLALFLFLRSLRWTNGANKYDITFRALFARLGLRHSRQGYERLSRTLRTALEHINDYLANLNEGDLKSLKSLSSVPRSYLIGPIGNQVRFLSGPRWLEERQEMEEYRAELAELNEPEPDDLEPSESDEEVESAAARKWRRRREKLDEEVDRGLQEIERKREQVKYDLTLTEAEDEDEDFRPMGSSAKRMKMRQTI
jgi:hypothetical protein